MAPTFFRKKYFCIQDLYHKTACSPTLACPPHTFKVTARPLNAPSKLTAQLYYQRRNQEGLWLGQFLVGISKHTRSFYKKPFYKQPSTRQPKITKLLELQRKELRNIGEIAYSNRLLIQRKAVPKQYDYHIALEFNSY